MFHLELRQFPHNACRFNVTEPQLRAIVLPWAREEWLEFGERKWNPNQARMTILEGPQLPPRSLTMGRGWRNAQRESEDVTERVLEAAKAQLAAAASQAAAPAPAPAQGASQDASADSSLLADSLGLELLALLEDAPAPLSQAWQLAHVRLPGRPAGECLALAEQAVSSLLTRRLIVLEPIDADESGGVLEGQHVQPALQALESWASGGQSGAIRMRRA